VANGNARVAEAEEEEDGNETAVDPLAPIIRFGIRKKLINLQKGKW
jgi:hypothetical protein